MKSSLNVDKLKDTNLRYEWSQYLFRMQKALKTLTDFQVSHENEFAEMEYLQAAMEFIETRDNERLFFWDAFMDKENEEVASKDS